jgi:hypothetical protein
MYDGIYEMVRTMVRMTKVFKDNIIIILSMLVMLTYGWVGYIASDDGLYSKAAESWINSFPYLGDNHWALRHTLVISTAISYYLFGVNEYSLSLTTTFYFIAIILLTYFYLRKINPGASLITALCIISIPLYAIEATISGCDIVELFFVLNSILIFYLGNQKQTPSIFFISGLMAGFAWLTRETSIVLPIFYTILFSTSYGNRKHYFWIAAGFASIALVEMLSYYLIKGDFLYRLWIDIDQGKSTGRTTTPPGTGNIEINKILNPIISLFLNQEFMLLYFLFTPASIWLFREKMISQELKSLLILFFWLAIVWFIVVGYGMGVRALPRYFSVTSYFAAVIVAAWLCDLFKKRKTLSLMLFTLFLSSNLVGIYVENKQPLYGERALLQWLIDNPSKEIYTDPTTLTSASYLLATHNLEKNGHQGRPSIETAFYLYNPNRVNQENRDPGYADQYQPLESWKTISTIEPERKWIGLLLEWIGIDQYLPDHIVKKLNYPVDSVTIYQTH